MNRAGWYLLLLVLGGCSLTREVPPVQYYRLGAPEATAVSPAVCPDRVVRVALLQAPQWLFGTAIGYSGTDHRRYTYTRAAWESSVVDQLQQLTEKRLIEAGLFGGVIPYKSLAKNDWLLEVRIEAMQHEIDASGGAKQTLMLYAVVVEQFDRRVIAQKTFVYTEHSEGADVQSAVDAWSRETQAYLDALSQWLRHQCEMHPKVERGDVDL